MKNVLAGFLIVVCACGPVVPEGVVATGMGFDGGADAGVSMDAGGSEASFDAGEADASAPSEDAGVDAGLPSVDAGVASRPDAGTVADAGMHWPNPGPFTSGARLYTADGQSFTVDRLGDALDHALTGAAPRHVILYVHGRACGGGGEPTKSLGDAIPELMADQRATVLMFSWPGSSTGCPIGFPENEARASGLAFAHVLRRLAWERSTRGATWSGVTFTLLSHSMGNLVTEEAAIRNMAALPNDLFATVLFQSSASAASGHATWLARAQWSQATYVSVNDGDNVLSAAGVGRGTRMGKSVSGQPLATNAEYFDVTAANVNHAYYLHGGMKGAHMRALYDSVLKGRPFNFATAAGVTRFERRNGTFIAVMDGN